MGYRQDWVRFKDKDAFHAAFENPLKVADNAEDYYIDKPCFGTWPSNDRGNYYIIIQRLTQQYTPEEVVAFYSMLQHYFPIQFKVMADVKKPAGLLKYLIAGRACPIAVLVSVSMDDMIERFGTKHTRWFRLFFCTLLRLAQEYPHVTKSAFASLPNGANSTPEELFIALHYVQVTARREELTQRLRAFGTAVLQHAREKEGLSFCIEGTWTPTGHGITGNVHKVLTDIDALFSFVYSKDGYQGINRSMDLVVWQDPQQTDWYKNIPAEFA